MFRSFRAVVVLAITSLILISISSSVLAWDSTMEFVNGGREQPIYRLYNVRTGEHLFTADLNEYNTLSASPTWNGENTAWIAPVVGDSVFRLFNKNTGFHLYTQDENEYSSLMYPCTTPWQADNRVGNLIYPIFRSGGPRNVYRLYNPGNKAHLLTADENEYNILARSGWNAEGVALTALR